MASRHLSRQGLFALGFVASAIVLGLVALLALRWVIASEGQALPAANRAILVANMQLAVETESAEVRGFLLTDDAAALARSRRARATFSDDFDQLRRTANSGGAGRLLRRVADLDRQYEATITAIIRARSSDPDHASTEHEFEAQVVPAKEALDAALATLAEHRDAQLGLAALSMDRAGTAATLVVGAVALAAVAASAALALLLRRALRDNERQAVELAASLERVARSNRDLDAFAGRVAHDVKNALNPLVAAAQLLERPDLSNARRCACAGRLARAGRHAVGFMDALLAFSRAAQPADQAASAPVRAVVADVLDELEPQIRESGAVVEADVADVGVRCPENLLRIIVSNVVGNALKFVHDSVERRVTVHAEATELGCDLQVEDTGPGIPEDARAHVFEPFYRAPGTKAAGSGIGLATVHRIAEAHGGSVRVAARDGGGACIHVVLPLAT